MYCGSYMASTHSIMAFAYRQQRLLTPTPPPSTDSVLVKQSVIFKVKHRKCRAVKVYAKGDDFPPSDMTLEAAMKLLGVREGATFDEILQAKNALIDKSGGEQDRIVEVEAAYDALLMQRLMKRRAGEVADSSVLYADVRKRKPASTSAPEWLKTALKKIPVDLTTPSSSALATQTAVFGVLLAWTYASGFNGDPLDGNAGVTTGGDATGITLAAGFGASLYFLRQQNTSLGKAAAITTAGLVAGAMMGNVVESWLRVDLVPVAGISSSAVVVSEFVLLWLWFVSLYLR